MNYKTIFSTAKAFAFMALISCNLKSNKAPETEATIVKEKVQQSTTILDTANVLNIIALATMPEPTAAGGNKKEVTKQSIKFYNDSNKDTILVMLQVNGTEISNQSVPIYGPNKPFESIENWKLYKVDGAMKAFINNIKN